MGEHQTANENILDRKRAGRLAEEEENSQVTASKKKKKKSHHLNIFLSYFYGSNAFLDKAVYHFK